MHQRLVSTHQERVRANPSRRPDAEMRRLLAEANDRERRILATEELILTVSSARSLAEVFPTVAVTVPRLVLCHCITITVFDPATRQFVVRFLRDTIGTGLAEGTVLRFPEPLIERMRVEREALMWPDPGFRQIDSERSAAWTARNSQVTGLTLPLLVQDRILGTFGVSRKAGPAFTARDADVLWPIARGLAIAVQGAHMAAQIEALAVREERNRLSREMHDGVGQMLGFVAMRAETAAELCRQGKHEQAHTMMLELAEVSRSAYAELRENIRNLRADASDATPLDTLLRDAMARYECDWGIATEMRVTGERPLACDAITRLHVERIVQEALTNARRHAAPTRVSLALACGDGWLEVVVHDDGKGFDPGVQPAGHFGLLTMRERAEAIGGRLRVESRRGLGTSVIIEAPLAAPNGGKL